MTNCECLISGVSHTRECPMFREDPEEFQDPESGRVDVREFYEEEQEGA